MALPSLKEHEPVRLLTILVKACTVEHGFAAHREEAATLIRHDIELDQVSDCHRTVLGLEALSLSELLEGSTRAVPAGEAGAGPCANTGAGIKGGGKERNHQDRSTGSMG